MPVNASKQSFSARKWTPRRMTTALFNINHTLQYHRLELKPKRIDLTQFKFAFHFNDAIQPMPNAKHLKERQSNNKLFFW